MSWQGILGHDAVVEQFRRGLSRGRLASTFLFVGTAGIGKATFAKRLAQTLLCREHPAEQLDPCGRCPGCTQVNSGTHPDLETIGKPPDKNIIPVERFIGPKERRMQEGLCHWISLKPLMGGRRVAIIDDADLLNQEGANSLLKTLEEPPPRSVLILIGTSPEKQLPTIRSRCQMIRFQPLPENLLAELLLSQQVVASADEARRLASYSEGSLDRARELVDPDLWQFRKKLLSRLATPNWDSVQLGRAVCAFVDEAGSEAVLRRARSRQLMGFVAEFYRHVLRGLAGAPLPTDADLSGPVRQMMGQQSLDPETVADCVARCLEAVGQVDRNANQSTMLETWIDDLSRLGDPLPR